MGSVKGEKLSEEIDQKHCEDRISTLPLCIIFHILTLLSTKEAVATSVLSTKWSRFWTLLTDLDLQDESFSCPETSRPLAELHFINFVYRAFENVPCLHKLRISSTGKIGISHASAWFAAALRPSVRELDLDLPMGRSEFVMPWDLLSRSNLVVLKLAYQFVMDVPASISLSTLKILHLAGVQMKHGDSINQLLSGCPVLEELSLMSCIGSDIPFLNISSPVLKKLWLSHLCYDNSIYLEFIVLDTPALRYLHIHDDDPAQLYSLFNLDQLATAQIFLLDLIPEYGDAIASLVNGVSNVQSLCLEGYFLEDIEYFNHQLGGFPYLTSLCIHHPYVDWVVLYKFLDNSPCLETLVLASGYVWSLPKENEIWHVPSCVRYYLRVIKIYNYDERNTAEKRLVDYFKCHAEGLKMIVTRRAVSDEVDYLLIQ